MVVEKTGTKSVVSMLAVGLFQLTRPLPPLRGSMRKKPRVQVRLLSAEGSRKGRRRNPGIWLGRGHRNTGIIRCTMYGERGNRLCGLRVDSCLLKTRAYVSGLIGVVDSLRNRVVSDISRRRRQEYALDGAMPIVPSAFLTSHQFPK